MTAEEWRDIPGFPSYEVSSAGRVRSYRPWRGLPVPRELRPAASGVGYLTLNLVSPERPNVTAYVHHLVALAFHGPRPQGLEIRHLDGNRLNNDADNLAYGTASENQKDRVRHGTHNHAVKTHCAKGHPFDERNTYITKVGQRACRECLRLRGKARRARERQARSQERAA